MHRSKSSKPVDSYCHLQCMTMRHGAYCDLSNRLEVRMTPKAGNLVLTKSQAACRMALRGGKNFKTKIAIQAGLDLVKTAAALDALAGLGLAIQGQTKRWHTSARGKTCRFETIPDRLRRNSGLPSARSPSSFSQRLLDRRDSRTRCRGQVGLVRHRPCIQMTLRDPAERLILGRAHV